MVIVQRLQYWFTKLYIKLLLRYNKTYKKKYMEVRLQELQEMIKQKGDA